MRVNNEYLGAALYRSPTVHWRNVLAAVRDEIHVATICKYGDIRIVEDEGWAKAMGHLRQLPRGGRHVAEDSKWMWYWINRATQGAEKGESK